MLTLILENNMPRNDGSGSYHRGMGKMGGNGLGSGGLCVCPSCGHRQSHVRGQPCTNIKCPQCGTALTRE